MIRTSLAWIQPHPHGAILRHILNMEKLFQITLSIDCENVTSRILKTLIKVINK
jgi:hypothetical protein